MPTLILPIVNNVDDMLLPMGRRIIPDGESLSFLLASKGNNNYYYGHVYFLNSDNNTSVKLGLSSYL